MEKVSLSLEGEIEPAGREGRKDRNLRNLRDS